MTRAVALGRRANATNSSAVPKPGPTRNDSYPWDEFDPDWYVTYNYLVLRDDDRRILQLVRDFFVEELSGRTVGRGIDVGTGANLYPALLMLPFCEEITLWERGRRNFDWLQAEIDAFSPYWDRYWDVLSARTPYAELDKPRQALRDKARVLNRNLFDLSVRQWDLGTMFFVAESISDKRREFKTAVERFVGSLRPGSPFAAAFMLGSTGYNVGSLRFPAVAVTEADVQHCLSVIAHDVRIVSVCSRKALRAGYHGMILALGKAGGTRS